MEEIKKESLKSGKLEWMCMNIDVYVDMRIYWYSCIDRKGLIQGRGWEWVLGYRYGIIDQKRERSM